MIVHWQGDTYFNWKKPMLYLSNMIPVVHSRKLKDRVSKYLFFLYDKFSHSMPLISSPFLNH